MATFVNFRQLFLVIATFVMILVVNFNLNVRVASASLAATPFIQSSPLNQGMLGWWTMDPKDTNWTTGTEKDMSGQGNDGRFSGMSTSTSPQPGRIGQSLQFDGSKSYIDATNAADNLASMSVGIWFRTSMKNGGILVSKINDLSAGAGWAVEMTNLGKIGFLIQQDGSNLRERYSQSSFNDNYWHHALVTKDSSNNLQLFIDGIAVSTTLSSAGTVSTYTNSLTVRIGWDRVDGKFLGTLDDVRIYNRALSASEVTELYNLGTVRVSTNPPKPLANLNNGLVSMWTFDASKVTSTGVLRDSTGSNNANPINISTSTFYREGKLGQGIYLDGVDDYVTIQNESNFDFTASNRSSVCAWINPTNVTDQNHVIISKDTNDSARTGWEFLATDGSNSAGLMFYISSGATANNQVYVASSNALRANVWQHVCYTYDGSSLSSGMSLYRNGVKLTNNITNDHAIGNILNNINVQIGKRNTLSTSLFPGGIDDVRVYNRTLSANEVLQLYQMGQAQVGTSQSNFLNQGLTSYFTFDGRDLVNGLFRDRVNSGRTATLFNISTSTFFTPGKIGQGITFDGVNDRIVTNFSIGATSDFTITFWERPQDISNVRYMYDEVNSGANRFYLRHLQKSGGVGQLLLGLCSWNPNIISGNSSVVENRWNYYTVTLSGQTGRFYINGVQTASQGGITLCTPGSVLRIGSDEIPGSFLKGTIDDFRIYNRALSQQEIVQLMQQGR